MEFLTLVANCLASCTAATYSRLASSSSEFGIPPSSGFLKACEEMHASNPIMHETNNFSRFAAFLLSEAQRQPAPLTGAGFARIF